MNNREQLAKDNGMTIEFVNWFFDNKKDGCGTAWFMMMAAMWEGWKAQEENGTALAAENARLKAKGRELLDEACKVYEKFNTTINPETGDFMDGQTLHEFQFVLDVDTPATDAFMAEVRAQGADAVADQHRRKYEELKPINVFFAEEHKEAQGVAEFVAAQLRQEAAQ